MQERWTVSVSCSPENLNTPTFGEQYRYGFNGKENEILINQGAYDFGARIYDSRLGRFLSIDPKIKDYPYASSYSFVGNRPIILVDINGEAPGYVLQDFLVAMGDYISHGWTNFRNWTEVAPENAADYNKGLQIADAFMVALALAEIEGGSSTAAAGLLTMKAV